LAKDRLINKNINNNIKILNIIFVNEKEIIFFFEYMIMSIVLYNKAHIVPMRIPIILNFPTKIILIDKLIITSIKTLIFVLEKDPEISINCLKGALMPKSKLMTIKK
jgi:hypothetical protein